MPTAIAGGVSSWLLGIGVTAGGGAVAAVGGAIAAGAVTGAVIGAASSALTGGDILDGALKGALMGGISAGVISAGSMAFSAVSGSSMGMGTAAEQLSSFGTTMPNVDPSVGVGVGATIQPAPGVYTTEPVQPGMLNTGQVPPVAAMSPEKAQIYSGIGQGVAGGIVKVGAAMMETESAEAMGEQSRANEAAAVAANQPGDFEARIANITLPDRWNQNINAFAPPTKPGLLSPEVPQNA